MISLDELKSSDIAWLFCPKLAGFSWPPDHRPTLAQEYLQFRDYQCSGKAVHDGEMYSKMLWTYSQLISVPFNGRYLLQKHILPTNHHLLTNSWLIQAEDIPPPKKKLSAELEGTSTPLLGTPRASESIWGEHASGNDEVDIWVPRQGEILRGPERGHPRRRKKSANKCELRMFVFIQTWQVFFNSEMLRVMKNVTEPWNLPPFTSKIQTSADFTVMLSAWIQLGLWGNFQHWKRPEVLMGETPFFLRWGILVATTHGVGWYLGITLGNPLYYNSPFECWESTVFSFSLDKETQ